MSEERFMTMQEAIEANRKDHARNRMLLRIGTMWAALVVLTLVAWAPLP